MFGFLKKRPLQQGTLWRQGDVFIIARTGLPKQGRAERRPVLAEGEATGHAHRVKDPTTANLFSIGSDLFMEVSGDSATIVHDEHQPVTVPRGEYEIRIQREYTPKEIRRVVD
jgi:hypothetical protein